jgi:pimeloyl-ACP methyl ester carboxylesterase
MPSFWARIPTLTVPMAVVVGEHDAKFRAFAERIGALSPGAKIHIVRGSGHNAVLEAPDQVASIIAGEVGGQPIRDAPA